MAYTQIIGCAAAGMAITLASIPLVLKLSNRWRCLQRAREVHHDAASVPRFGGAALVLAFAGVQFLTAIARRPDYDFRTAFVIFFSSLAMFATGFWDDLRPIGARKKLLLQILIAAVVCSFGFGIEQLTNPFSGNVISLHGWGFLVTILWLVGTTNLINLVDGVDGLAGGICLMLMSLLAYECTSTLQLLAAGMAGALLAFLRFNFPPARIYMGDGGAYLLGFQIGLFSLVSSQKGAIAAALVAPMFVLGLPIVDVALAILRRGLRGLPVFRADRNHLHHHLLDMGFSRRKVVLYIYAVTLVFMAMGFVTFWSNGRWTAALVGLCALILLLCAGRLRFSREWFAVGRTIGNSLAMRRDIQSAVCLTRWLAVEARRNGSAENLWADLVFVAQRLGFASVRLTINGATRTWQRPAANTHCFQHRNHSGTVELRAANESARLASAAGARLADAKLFFITSELVVEGWTNAIKNWEAREHRAFHLSEIGPADGISVDPFAPMLNAPDKTNFFNPAQVSQTVSH